MSVFGSAGCSRGQGACPMLTLGFVVSPMRNGGSSKRKFAEKMAKTRRSIGAGTNCERWRSLSRLSVVRGAGITFPSTLKDVLGAIFGTNRGDATRGRSPGTGQKRDRHGSQTAAEGTRSSFIARGPAARRDVRALDS